MLARGFAAAYLTCDEDDPLARGRALAGYLPGHDVATLTRLGWSGRGRNAADFVLHDATTREGTRLIVHLRSRVRGYRSGGTGWEVGQRWWTRLQVPVCTAHGRLVIDTARLTEPTAEPVGEPTSPAGSAPAARTPGRDTADRTVSGAVGSDPGESEPGGAPAQRPPGPTTDARDPTAEGLVCQVWTVVRHACELYLAPSPSTHSPSTHCPRTRAMALLETWVAGFGDAVAARSVLAELEQLVRVEPPAQGADQLWWQLERIRATSHELAELDLIEQLRGRRLRVPEADRGVALRLLGADGADPRSRLGLGADADLDRVRAAAAQQRDRWQQLAAHPATSRALRTLADTVARTCELLPTGQSAPSQAARPSPISASPHSLSPHSPARRR
jgi:hypothetical protein